MSAISAPVYANIFVATFELKYICPYIKCETKIFLRFIDDLFIDDQI